MNNRIQKNKTQDHPPTGSADAASNIAKSLIHKSSGITNLADAMIISSEPATKVATRYSPDTTIHSTREAHTLTRLCRELNAQTIAEKPLEWLLNIPDRLTPKNHEQEVSGTSRSESSLEGSLIISDSGSESERNDIYPASRSIPLYVDKNEWISPQGLSTASSFSSIQELASPIHSTASSVTSSELPWNIIDKFERYQTRPEEGITAYLLRDRTLAFEVKVGENTPRGKVMFQEAIDYLKSKHDEPLRIKGLWFAEGGLSDNYTHFIKAIKEGCSAEDAALKHTFTGVMAARQGYTEVEVTDHTPGFKVEVFFSKPNHNGNESVSSSSGMWF